MAFYVADFETTTPKPTLYDLEEFAGNDELVADIDFIPDFDYANPMALWEMANDTHVWLWGVCPVLEHPIDLDVDRGHTIGEFLNYCSNALKNRDVVYFHNLGFDVTSIIPALEVKFVPSLEDDVVPALEEMGFTRDLMEPFVDANGKEQRRTNPKAGTYSVLCSDTGAWYELRVCFKKSHVITFRDSLKILPGSVDSIGKDLKTKARKLKGTIDYTKPRPVGYLPTFNEIRYLNNDVLVMSEALFKMFVEVPILTECLTIGSAAMKEFYRTLAEAPPGGQAPITDPSKQIKMGREIFRDLCPELTEEQDSPLRPAYRGGFCQNATDGAVICFCKDCIAPEATCDYGVTGDVNSLYPSVMFNHVYPIGFPVVQDPSLFWTLRHSVEYFVKIRGEFIVKDGHVPFLQGSNGRFGEQVHIADSEGVIEFSLCRPDFELFLEQYDIGQSFEIVTFTTFDSMRGIFDRYVEKFYAMKNSNKVAGKIINPVLYLFAKLMLNSLYGKMGQAPNRPSGYPIINAKGAMQFLSEAGTSKGGYIPIGAYITAYARAVTVRGAQAIIAAGGVFDYADTDSLHAHNITIERFKEILSVGDELGQWDHEMTWDKARFVRQKTYMERETMKVVDGEQVWLEPHEKEIHIKACGAPAAVKERMRYKVTHTDTTTNHTKFSAFKRGFCGKILDEKRSDDELFDRFTHGLVEAGKLMRQSVPGGTILRETTFRIS